MGKNEKQEVKVGGFKGGGKETGKKLRKKIRQKKM